VIIDREVTITATPSHIRVRNAQTGGYDTRQITTAASGTPYPAGTVLTFDSPFGFSTFKGDSYLLYEEGQERLIEITEHSIENDLTVRVNWLEYDETVYDTEILSFTDTQQSQSNAHQQQNRIIGNVENLTVNEQPPKGASQNDSPEVYLSWNIAESARESTARHAIWARKSTGLYRQVAELSGSETGASVALTDAEANTQYHFAVQPISKGGGRRSPDLCSHVTLIVVGRGAKPEPPTGFSAEFNEDTVTYSWTLPSDSPALVVEARAGGWELGRTVFVSGAGANTFGPFADWSAGRMTIRSMNAAGHFSEPVLYDLDTSEVERDIDATDVDPLLGNAEWETYVDGWIEDADNVSPKPVLTGMERDADGFLVFSTGELVGTYTTTDPTTDVNFVRTAREMYVEANCLAFQVYNQPGDLSTFSPALEAASPMTGDGFAHNRDDFDAGVTMLVEARVARVGTGWGPWRVFHPALIQSVAVQFRFTITRIDEDHDVQVRSFRTSVASRTPSLYDVTPEDFTLRNEAESYG